MPNELDKSDGTRAQPLAKWQRTFLACLTKTPHVTRACKAARVSRSRAYDTRKVDPQFAAAWEDAIAGSIDNLEETAFKLAVEGDSSLISFLLRCHRPEIYRDTQRMEIDARHVGVIFLPEKESKAP